MGFDERRIPKSWIGCLRRCWTAKCYMHVAWVTVQARRIHESPSFRQSKMTDAIKCSAYLGILFGQFLYVLPFCFCYGEPTAPALPTGCLVRGISRIRVGECVPTGIFGACARLLAGSCGAWRLLAPPSPFPRVWVILRDTPRMSPGRRPDHRKDQMIRILII